MKQLRRVAILTVLVALSGACFAAGSAVQASPPKAKTTPGPVAAPAPQGLPKFCLDVRTDDKLTKEFADRLRKTIAASGALSLAPTADSCSLQLRVPGNLLRFETAGGVMVGTVVIVTSGSGRYLSTSIAACQASDLEPCAERAIAAAKLALLAPTHVGT
jgi:hypothetical protein